MSAVRYQVSGIRYQVSGIRYQVSGIRFQVSAVRYQLKKFGQDIGNKLTMDNCFGSLRGRSPRQSTLDNNN